MRRSTLIIAGFSLVFIIFVFYSLFRIEPLHVTDGHIMRLGNAVVVQGTVVNTGSQAQTAGLKVQLFDSAGRQLAMQTVALGKLAPGQSVGFQSRPIPASAAEKFTIQVDRGANMYGN